MTYITLRAYRFTGTVVYCTLYINNDWTGNLTFNLRNYQTFKEALKILETRPANYTVRIDETDPDLKKEESKC